MITHLSIPLPPKFLASWLRLHPPAEGSTATMNDLQWQCHLELRQIAKAAILQYTARIVEMAAVLPAAPNVGHPGAPAEPS